jgi:hypothetical protein
MGNFTSNSGGEHENVCVWGTPSYRKIFFGRIFVATSGYSWRKLEMGLDVFKNKRSS